MHRSTRPVFDRQPEPRRLRELVARTTALACAVFLGTAFAPVAAQVDRAAPPNAAPITLPVAPPPQAGEAESLPALLARVLAANPQVQVAQLLLRATEERRLQARSRLGPTVAVTVTRGTAQETEFGRDLERRTDRSEAALRWNLYNYGNDAAELTGATRDVAAAAEDLRRAREEVVERIAEPYVELLRVDNLLPRSAERLAAVSRLSQQVQRQAQLGKASDADAQQAQASLLDAEIAHEQILSDHASARQRLSALIGDQARPVLPVALPASAASADLAQPRPGVVAAAIERAQAARSRVRPVLSLLAPRIDLDYRQRLSDRTTPQATTEQRSGWQLTARWELPVGGENQSRRAENERRAEASEAEAERVMQGVRSELVALGPRIANTGRSVAQLERQIAQYDALVRAGELQFEAGRRSLAQLVQLHDSRFSAEQRRIEQVHRLLGAQLRELALSGALLPALGLTAD